MCYNDGITRKETSMESESKPFSDCYGFCLDAYSETNGKRTTLLYCKRFNGSAKDAADFMTEFVLNELGDGDGENGGRGSLKNCRDEIRDILCRDGFYSYADCFFRIIPNRTQKVYGSTMDFRVE